MASYLEIRNLFADTALRNRVEVACIVEAEAIRNEDPGTTDHANRLIWARKAFQDPQAVRDEMLMALLAANKDAAPAAITGATDEQIQTKVSAAVDVFADGT